MLSLKRVLFPSSSSPELKRGAPTRQQTHGNPSRKDKKMEPSPFGGVLASLVDETGRRPRRGKRQRETNNKNHYKDYSNRQPEDEQVAMGSVLMALENTNQQKPEQRKKIYKSTGQLSKPQQHLDSLGFLLEGPICSTSADPPHKNHTIKTSSLTLTAPKRSSTRVQNKARRDKRERMKEVTFALMKDSICKGDSLLLCDTKTLPRPTVVGENEQKDSLFEESVLAMSRNSRMAKQTLTRNKTKNIASQRVKRTKKNVKKAPKSFVHGAPRKVDLTLASDEYSGLGSFVGLNQTLRPKALFEEATKKKLVSPLISVKNSNKTEVSITHSLATAGLTEYSHVSSKPVPALVVSGPKNKITHSSAGCEAESDQKYCNENFDNDKYAANLSIEGESNSFEQRGDHNVHKDERTQSFGDGGPRQDVKNASNHSLLNQVAKKNAICGSSYTNASEADTHAWGNEELRIEGLMTARTKEHCTQCGKSKIDLFGVIGIEGMIDTEVNDLIEGSGKVKLRRSKRLSSHFSRPLESDGRKTDTKQDLLVRKKRKQTKSSRFCDPNHKEIKGEGSRRSKRRLVEWEGIEVDTKQESLVRKKRKRKTSDTGYTSSSQTEIQSEVIRRSKRRRSQPHWFGRTENEAKSIHSDGKKRENYSLGTKVRKRFRSGWFTGKIISFDNETLFYKIEYEDGDVEEVDEKELVGIILTSGNKPGKQCRGKKKTRSQREQLLDSDEIDFSSVGNKQHSSRECTGTALDALLSTQQSYEAEDDVFNATPVQNLFQRKNSEGSSVECNDPDEENRKSYRRSSELPKKHLGGERSGKSVFKSALKQKKDGNIQTNKRVRISNEGLEKNENENEMIGNSSQEWTSSDLQALYSAHKTVDPKSVSFWEDVSEHVGEKSALECREKWFSLVKTPIVKKKSKKSSKNTAVAISNEVPSKTTNEDDIFNATPMRGMILTGLNVCGAPDFEEFENISKMINGSAIKVIAPKRGVNSSPQQDIMNDPYPQGYKTYIQNMRRNMRLKDPAKDKGGRSRELHPFCAKKHLAEKADEGDVEVSCRMSPGGTLQVKSTGDSEAEDYLDYDTDQ